MSSNFLGVPGIAQTGGAMPSSPASLDQSSQGAFRYGEQSLWSTQMHQNGAVLANGTFNLFGTAQQSVGQGFTRALSLAETNIVSAGRVPNGVAYDVYGISCYMAEADGGGDAAGRVINTPFNDITANPDAIAQLLNIVNNGVLAWSFQQAIIDIAPIVMIGAGGGIFGPYASDNAAAGAIAARGSVNNGAGAIYSYMRELVYLPGDTVFHIRLRYGNRAAVVGASSIVIRVHLLGMYRATLEVA